MAAITKGPPDAEIGDIERIKFVLWVRAGRLASYTKFLA